jgi:MFS family permease
MYCSGKMGWTLDEGIFIVLLQQIFLGWAGDQPWMNVTKAYAANLVLCGITIVLMPIFVRSYWLLTATVALFGLFFASTFSFTPPILVQLIPLERFTTAYGLILLCQGIGNLLGPPLGGKVCTVTLYDCTRLFIPDTHNWLFFPQDIAT